MITKVLTNEYLISLNENFRIRYKYKPCRGIRWVLNLGYISIVKWEENE